MRTPRKPISALLLLLCVAAPIATAHDLITTKITWSREISRLVNARCISCHGPKSAIPFTTYDEARPWAKAIRDEVLNRTMPPWGALKGYGDLRNDPSLSQEQLNQIAEWVEGGAPEGDARYLPAAPPTKKPASKRPVKLAPPNTRRSATLYGIHPTAGVADAKLHAELPDGSLIPILWLRNYKSQWNRTFLLREPLYLPSGSRLIAEPSFPFLVSLFPSP